MLSIFVLKREYFPFLLNKVLLFVSQKEKGKKFDSKPEANFSPACYLQTYLRCFANCLKKLLHYFYHTKWFYFWYSN